MTSPGRSKQIYLCDRDLRGRNFKSGSMRDAMRDTTVFCWGHRTGWSQAITEAMATLKINGHEMAASLLESELAVTIPETPEDKPYDSD